MRAIECYRNLVLGKSEPDLTDIVMILARFGKRERNLPLEDAPTEEELARLRGNISRNEMRAIQLMREQLRVLHYSMATESAYVRWVVRFSKHVGSTELNQFNEQDIGTFLTSLAVEAKVSASTQNQALSALLFLYQCVLGRRLGFIDAVRVKRPETISVWFSPNEIERLLEHMVGPHRLMFLLMYGAGLRHKECRRLRIKDVCFDQRLIVVRNGKGDKDRITLLPEEAIPELKRQIEIATRLHRIDLEAGYEQIYMPYALAKKYPNACKEIGWRWIFPSRQRCRDKRSGIVWRYHISERQFCDALKDAQRLAKIDKQGVPHSLRHSFATHLVEVGTDIQTVQKLMGHKDVETTMKYVHTSPRLGVDVKSPADLLARRRTTKQAETKLGEY
ncbi:integron integrase [Rhodopirellula sp. MGV]|uniref:integron integrase n=1 Tax=Rhodopirellula sp. MGV TaxID=2023130 RepID=UPI0013045974|nr:integron integrase [Rhodopirellula sp. MGV]